MKQCSLCGKKKPLEEFWKNSRTKDGREARCATCRKGRQKKTTKEYKERKREVEYFDFVAFGKALHDFAKRVGACNSQGVPKYTQISYVTWLARDVIRCAFEGYVATFKTVAILADWADLSIDKYVKRNF